MTNTFFDFEALNLFEDEPLHDGEYLGNKADLVSQWSLRIEEEFDDEITELLEDF